VQTHEHLGLDSSSPLLLLDSKTSFAVGTASLNICRIIAVEATELSAPCRNYSVLLVFFVWFWLRGRKYEFRVLQRVPPSEALTLSYGTNSSLNVHLLLVEMYNNCVTCVNFPSPEYAIWFILRQFCLTNRTLTHTQSTTFMEKFPSSKVENFLTSQELPYTLWSRIFGILNIKVFWVWKQQLSLRLAEQTYAVLWLVLRQGYREFHIPK